MKKITDYFSSSLLADVDFDAWDEDDNFCAGIDDDNDESVSFDAKRLKTDDDNEKNN